MKTNFNVFRKFLMLFALLAIVSCSKDDVTTPPVPLDTDQDGIVDANDDCPNEAGPASNNGCPETIGTGLAEVVASGNAFENFPPNISESDVAGTESQETDTFDRMVDGETVQQRWVCTEKEVDITGGSHTFPLYNTNASVIWPGNLLQGKTLDNATPSDIVVKRAGGTITYNLVTGNPVATDSVAVIDQGTVQQAMNNIIAQNGDITPANFTLDVVAVNSSEQLALEMGLKASTLTTKVSSDFSLNTSTETSSVLVKLTQQYYTMSYVKPTSLDEVFDPSVTPTQLGTFIQPDNPATFISSVTYGRIFYMLYESTASAQDMEAALRGSYNAVAGKVSGSVDIQSLKDYNNLTVKVIAYGGDSEGTLNSVGAVFGGAGSDPDETVNNLEDIVNRLAQSSDIAGGLPLSYVVNSLEDPSQVVSTNLATRYTVKNCELKGILPPSSYQSLVGLFEDGVGAAAQVAGPNAVLYNKAGTKYAWFNVDLGEVLGVYDIKDPNGPLGASTFDAVRAAVNIADGKIHIYNETGLLTEIFNYSSCECTGSTLPTTLPIGDYSKNDTGERIINPVNIIFGDSSFPFAGEGFEAASRYYRGRDSDGANIVHFFGRPGNEYAGYFGDGTWTVKLDANEWGDGSQTHFERIGAACRITIGGESNIRQLFFNEDGTEFTIFNPFATGEEDEFSPPWIII